MPSLRIAEIFASIQGEGIWTGTPSIFVRVSGCNLRCVWCDTPYASWNPEGPNMGLDEIQQRVQDLAGTSIRHVVVTGGEPMLFPPASELTGMLKGAGFTITIETAGTVYREVACDLMSISPKLANSDPAPEGVAAFHRERRTLLTPLRELLENYTCQLKFVVNPELNMVDQIAEIETLLASASAPDHPVLLMAEGVDSEVLRGREALLVPVCMERGWRVSGRRHIDWFGNKRGT